MGRRLILSRKGFDSGFGGRPSPVLPDGTMVSLPIPDDGSDLTYSQCRAPTGETYLELLLRLGAERIRYPAGGGRSVSLDMADDPGVHLDPDLHTRALPRLPGWRPAFGQVGPSQTHLANHGVGPGDVFLFFGWFSSVAEQHGRLRYPPRRESVQALFGWLEVEDVLPLDRSPAPPWARQHPHVQAGHLPRYRKNNTLYTAPDESTLAPGLPGGGIFTWDSTLQLTRPGATPSVWRLPVAFHPDNTPTPLTHHALGSWEHDGAYTTLRSARIGQEFVVSMTPHIEEWVVALIANRD